MIDIQQIPTLEYGDNAVKAFTLWYKQKPLGDSVVYFRGFLALYLSTAKSEGIDKMQTHVLNMAEQEKVQLTQFRHAEKDYSYVAKRVR